MNFTSDIKKELMKKPCDNAEAKAALSAYFSVCGVFAEEKQSAANTSRPYNPVGESQPPQKEPKFFLVSETERVAEYFTDLFYNVFCERLSVSRAVKDRLRGRSRLILEYQKSADAVLETLGLFDKRKGLLNGVPKAFFKTEKLRRAYLSGAFLGGGSVTLPLGDTKTGYHLEFAFPYGAYGEGDEEKTAKEFCAMAEKSDLLFKCVRRGSETVAYMKSKEAISDFLSVLGTENALKKFTEFCKRRELNNRLNRAANCSSSNADKTATAAVKQVLAIEKITAAGADKQLSAELKETIKFRVSHPEMSLKEMADRMNVSKSCLNHRIRKLMDVADKLPGSRAEKTDNG
ncbi:MAG: DNA-binding protein WhiA [Candidatus Borkfalkiaceae bacterium]|nr:DNA-binding protein WhiA [Clostridia bacterium]MDY6222945.1 DNA-binding protein WhiA [Christensenellaceae bacterium]